MSIATTISAGRPGSGVFALALHCATLLGSALLIGSALALAGCKPAAPAAPPPPEVEVARVLQATIAEWDEYNGRIEAVENVQVRPRVSGYIDRIEFTQGKLVRQGDLLVRIDPRPYQAEVDRAAAEHRRASVAQELARKELQRVEQLRSSGAVSVEELDERHSTLAQAEAGVAVARAALDAARLDLSFTRVTAPIDGRVGRPEVTRGNLISGGPNGGTLLTTVVSLDPVYVDFEGDEGNYLRYSAMIRSGERPSPRDTSDPAEVGLANEEGFPHRGYVSFVDNQINPQTGTVRARAVLDNKDGYFTPGMFARIRVRAREARPAVLIEDRAVATDQSRKYVLVLGADNLLAYRAVKLGSLSDGLRVVREGLKGDETIVVNGLQRVRSGATVTPKPVTMGAALAAPATAQN